MLGHSTEISVPARFSALPALIAHIEQQAQRAGIGLKCQQRMQLVIEELFANTIRHGYRKECEAPVHLQVTCTEKQCRLRYSDNAPPFDLLHAPTAPTNPDQIGGAGLKLIRHLTNSIRVQNTAEGNSLELIVERLKN